MANNLIVRVPESDLRAVTAMIRASGEFDPREHPRYPKGFPKGGRFAPKGVSDKSAPEGRARQQRSSTRGLVKSEPPTIRNFVLEVESPWRQLAGKFKTMEKSVIRLKEGVKEDASELNPNVIEEPGETSPYEMMLDSMEAIDKNLNEHYIPWELVQKFRALSGWPKVSIGYYYFDSLVDHASAYEHGAEANEVFVKWLKSADEKVFKQHGYDKLVKQAEERIRTYRAKADVLYNLAREIKKESVKES